MNEGSAKPFLKWVGGKGHLLKYIREKYPSQLGEKYTTYIEPFVGGGAVLFDVLSKYPIKRAIINDINEKLINAYLQVRDNPECIISQLMEMQDRFREKQNDSHSFDEDLKHRAEVYYSYRMEFNGGFCSKDREAALLLFLNKTCFNGLYRENRKGEFNTPLGCPSGKRNAVTICDENLIMQASKLLKNVEIHCGRYQEVLKNIDGSAFIYVDPPYRPISSTESFTSYHKDSNWTDREQVELVNVIKECINKGAFILYSNSDPKNTDSEDNFFEDAFGTELSRVVVTRFIRGQNKKHVSEILTSFCLEDECLV